ncbi:hypothetical protein Dsin_001943 [Dipteronia sinensis]|uniref:UPF3 domain-containing protein n=1 Tax=Dipteronia sinensis TaxID=43782 RepID=A0AAE0EJG5_9ROSI|nr:hypothetical protein Dsin_001943 [Dipteronia sinensis]
MKDPLQRTKVVIRHLPPPLSQSDFLALIHDRIVDRHNWFAFRPGKSSHKQQRHARAYLDLKRPEDVLEFAELFDGHVFVNDKGAQFKAIVEYAPSQRAPKPCSKKDSREGTIYKDPDYLEFLKLIAKPVEHLPSAEIQLERKEAELAGVAKEPPVVTPLMEYVRNKRAENATQGPLAIGKVGRRSRAASTSKSGSSTTKRGSEKKKYILKDSAKNASRKDKSTFFAMLKKQDQPASSSVKEMSESEAFAVCGVEGSVSGITLTSEPGKKKILLLKGKERDISHVPDTSQQQGETSAVGIITATGSPKQIQRRDSSGRLIRSILLSNDARQSRSLTAMQPQQKTQTSNLENGKQPPRSINIQPVLNGHMSKNDSSTFNHDGDTKRAPDDRFVRKDVHGLGTVSEKQEKRTRNKDRPDRGVWTPLRRSDVSQATGESSLQSTQVLSKLTEDGLFFQVGNILVLLSSCGLPVNHDGTVPSSGRNSMENGSHKHSGRRVAAHKDDGISEGKSSKRRGSTASGAHEKQVWIQKSSSGF